MSLPLEYRACAAGISFFFSCRMPCGRISSDTDGESGSPSLTVLRVEREARGGSYSDGPLGNVARPRVETPAMLAYASGGAAQNPPPTSPKGGVGASAVAVPIARPAPKYGMSIVSTVPFLATRSCARARSRHFVDLQNDTTSD